MKKTTEANVIAGSIAAMVLGGIISLAVGNPRQQSNPAPVAVASVESAPTPTPVPEENPWTKLEGVCSHDRPFRKPGALLKAMQSPSMMLTGCGMYGMVVTWSVKDDTEADAIRHIQKWFPGASAACAKEMLYTEASVASGSPEAGECVSMVKHMKKAAEQAGAED